MVIGHRDGGGVKGVGFEDIRARFQVAVVDRADDVRLGQHQQIVIAFQVALPIGKTRAAVILFFQLITLDHGAHAAVQHQNTLL
ncbi:hypothetical protein GGER_48430 [Serratia rubidaea]